MHRSCRRDILWVIEDAGHPVGSRYILERVSCAYTTVLTHLKHLRADGAISARRVYVRHRTGKGGGNPMLLYSLGGTAPPPAPALSLVRAFDGDPFWADVVTAMLSAAREREEKGRA